MNRYAEFGHGTREDYLRSVAEDTGLDYETVLAVAEALGPSEDFDGLLSVLEDADEY